MPFETYKQILRGKKPDLTGKELILLKIIGMGDPIRAERLNRYLFTIDKRIVHGLLTMEIRSIGRMPAWIKKEKKKDEPIDKLLDEYFTKMELSHTDLNENIILYREIGKRNMRELLRGIGAEEKVFKKWKVDLDKKMPEIKQSNGWW